jgi:hypothetical protein
MTVAERFFRAPAAPRACAKRRFGVQSPYGLRISARLGTFSRFVRRTPGGVLRRRRIPDGFKKALQ